MKRISTFALLGTFMLLAACASKQEEYVERPAEELYLEARAKMDDGDFKKAASLFDEVERQHPYSSWATRGQLMSAFAHYKEMKYDEAVLTLDRFIELHPGHPQIAYAYYMKALCLYEQISDVRRDQQTTADALEALQTVVRRFPDTPYAKDAKLKIDLTMDHLAGKEMQIGRYYQKQGNYQAAINRFDRVVKEYQTTSHVPEALLRLVECDLSLGLVDEAKRNGAVLGYNYPGTDWYQSAYRLLVEKGAVSGDDKSWLGRMGGGIF